MVMLVVPPAGGDELQGVKKGIMEVADAVVVNKSDGALIPAARNAEAEYRRALQLVRPKHEGWLPRVMRCSALAGGSEQGLDRVANEAASPRDVGDTPAVADVWALCDAFRTAMGGSAGLVVRRRAQGEAWMWSGFARDLYALARASPAVQSRAQELAALLGEGHIAPRAATRALLRTFGRACSDAAASSVG